MKTLSSLPKKQLVAALVLFFLFCACYEFTSVEQPGSAEPNSSFTVDIQVTTNDGYGEQFYYPFFGIMLPEGWVVTDSISFIYNEGNGVFVHSDSATLAMEGIDDADPGYYWWVGKGVQKVVYDFDHIYSFSPEITTDDQSGNFYIDYMAGSSSNGYGGGLNWTRSDNHVVTVGLPDEIVVSSSASSGPGSLRNAIDDIDFYGTITFNLDEGNTINLTEELIVYKDVTIQGDEIDMVTLSGGNQSRVLNIASYASPTLKNLTIQNGFADYGAGMYCYEHTAPVIENTIFQNNVAEYGGGAIYLYNASPEFYDSFITNNNAGDGGGIYCSYNSEPILESTTISYNSAQNSGGGIYSDWESFPTFESTNRSSIFLNTALYGTDLNASGQINVVVDTFTVITPTEMHASPLNNFSFDILNAKIEQADADLYVSPVGDDSNSGLTPEDPLKTVSVAMLKILTGPNSQHSIYLEDGTYSPSTTGENFPIVMRDYVTVQGNSTGTVILDAEQQSQHIIFNYNLGSSLKNMTLTGGLHTNGGAIYCNSSSPVLQNLIISENRAWYDGGGLYISYYSYPELINLTIKNNSAGSHGGGIYASSSIPDFSPIDRCNIYMNMAEFGMDILSYSYFTVILDTFTVADPTEYQAYPLENFDFDIMEGLKELVNEDIYVSPQGDNMNSGLTEDEPLKNISIALSLLDPQTGNPLTIHLLDGTFSPSTTGEIFPLIMRNYVNMSGVSSETVILDAEQSDKVIEFSQVNSSLLENMSITGGEELGSYGGGLYLYYSSPDLTNLKIYNNTAYYGGGIYFNYSSPMVSNIEVYDNYSTNYGGGLYIYQSDFYMENITIYNNESSYYGGGLYMESSSPEIVNSLIDNNSSEYSGGAAHIDYYSHPTLSNVSIRNNTSENGGGLYFGYSSSAFFDSENRCNIYMNQAEYGDDLYSESNMEIVVDTFTVLYPKYQHAYPLSNFDFDILNGIIPQVEADLFVSPDGDNDNTGLTLDDPLQTIEHALVKIVEDSLNLYTIHLEDGTYSPSTNGESFPLLVGEYINLLGSSTDAVILDAEQTGSVLQFEHVTGLTISQITIQGGFGEYAGGIYCNNSDVVLDNLKITENHSNYGGGGIRFDNNVIAAVSNSVITGNSSNYIGGGISADNWCQISLTNLEITNNSSFNDGGGIYLQDSEADLEEVLISNNATSYSGGGFYSGWGTNSTFKGVSIVSNEAASGGGIYAEESGSITFDYDDRSNIYFNAASYGRDIYSDASLDVVLDTFTVLVPTEYFVLYMENLTFDILNGKIEQVDADLYVSPSGDNDNSGLTNDDPLKTIDMAMMKIVASGTNQHTIFLAEGTYSGDSNGEFFPLTMIDYVSLSGEDKLTTILDGENKSNLLHFDYSYGNDISNLTLTNGQADYGGGIYCFSSSPDLQNLIISNNFASSGGGIYCSYHSFPMLDSITISFNTATYGGGMSCNDQSEPYMTNSTITDNTSSWNGGGLFCNYDSNISSDNVIIKGNSANYGGGVFCDNSSSPNFNNALISDNSADYGGGVYSIDNSYPFFENSHITYNNAMESGGGFYCEYNSFPVFDQVNRSNIYLNAASSGRDIYALNNTTIIVDTFTVLNPTKIFADPIENFEFDILNGLIEQVDQDLYVSPDGDNDNSGLTEDEPLQTLHFAFSKILATLEDPRTIHLLEGTYSPASNGENFPINPIDYITLSGAGSDLVVLDAEGSSTVLKIQNCNGIFVNDLSVTGGSADYGAGIYVYNSIPTITNVKIYENEATYNGGGMELGIDAHPFLENVTITNNSATNGSGGGIFCGYQSSLNSDNLVISGNYAQYEGGGMAMDNSNDIVLSDLIISDNTCDSYGGGISAYYTTLYLDDVLIHGNNGYNGGGIYSGYGSSFSVSKLTVRNNVATSIGGGIFFQSSDIDFDSVNRSNIYFNQAETGNDLYSNYEVSIVVDTFTVLIPKSHQASPLTSFTFDILNGMLEQEQFELYVSPEGDNTNGGEDPNDALKTISYAISKIDSDTVNFYNINLASGTYSSATNGENFPIYLDDFVKMSGTSAEETILDAESQSQVISINSKVGVELSNMTITGGNTTTYGYAGGIFAVNSRIFMEQLIISNNNGGLGAGVYSSNSEIEMIDCEINNNVASNNGGGIWCDNNSVIHIEDSRFSDNSGNDGGGIFIEYCQVYLSEVTLSGNISSSQGGAIYAGYYSDLEIENSLLENNHSFGQGGALYAGYNDLGISMSGSTLRYNNADDKGGGIYFQNSSNIQFDEVNRSNIYLNSGGEGWDLYTESMMHVVVDTFTVLFPKTQHTYPLNLFTFDILNGMIPQVEADVYVSPDGDNSNSGLTPEEPMLTINHALSMVAEDSINIYTVNLLEGVYSPSSNGEAFPIQMVHYIELSGTSSDEVILDAEGQSRVINFEHVQQSEINNLTITGGFTDNNGGGIYCKNSSPLIENVIFTDNYASSGGGFYCEDFSFPQIENVLFSFNTSVYNGGAISTGYSCELEVNNTQIENNVSNSGGGVYTTTNSVLLLNQSVLKNNEAENGGAVYSSFGSTTTVSSTQIVENSALQNGGGIYNESNSGIILEDSRIVNNVGGSEGGGIWNSQNGQINFDVTNRSSIYLNHAPLGNELFCEGNMNVVVDTFSVFYPKNYHAYPIYNFTFDILFGLFPQVEADLYVSPDGDNMNSGLTPEEPLKNVFFATSIIAEDSLSLYTIHLANGTYSPSSNEEYFPMFIPEHVGLHGEDMNLTILDAEQTASVLNFKYSHNVSIKNLTVKGGVNPYGKGGGIFMENSTANFTNILVTQNTAKYGAGIYIENSSPVMKGLIVDNNEAQYSGAGICCYSYASPIIDSSQIINNITSTYGGGIYCSYQSSPVLTNLTISNNMASTGAAMYCGNNSSPTIEDVLISENTAEHSGGGIYGPYSNLSLNRVIIRDNVCTGKGGAAYLSNFTNTIENSIITNNTAEDGAGFYFSASEPILVNVVIAENIAERFGGALYVSVSEPVYENLTIVGNTAEEGSGIYSYRSNIDIKNTILKNTAGNEVYYKESGSPSSLIATYSAIQGGEDGIITNDNGTFDLAEGIILEDPLLLGTGDHPFELADNSPCIEAGTIDITELHQTPMDVRGNHRFWDADEDGDSIIDVGAYEYGAPIYIVGMPFETLVNSSDLNISLHPNPVSHSAVLSIELAGPETVYVEIRDLAGNRILKLADKLTVQGIHQETINMDKLNSGIYILQVRTAKEIINKKFIKLR